MDFIDVGTAMRFDLTGSPGGPCTVLIHEMGGSLETWDAVVPLLGTDGCVLRYDVRGCGLSERIAGDVAVETLADDLLALLDALGIVGRVKVAGVAVGAAIALCFAARHAGRCEGLTLVSPAIGIEAARREERLAFADTAVAAGMRAVCDAVLDLGYPPVLRDRDPNRYAAFRARWLANDPESFRSLYRMLVHMDLDPHLSAVRCPVLGIGAEHDAFRPPQTVEALMARLDDGRFLRLATGHFAPVQTPAEIAMALSTRSPSPPARTDGR